MNSFPLKNETLALAIKAAKRAEKSLFWAGVWDSETAYKPGAVCKHQGATYLAVRESVFAAPHADSEDWVQIARAQTKSLGGYSVQPGTPGAPGKDGEDGQDGADATSVKSVWFEENKLFVELTDGHLFKSPDLTGKAGDAGKDGVGIADIRFIDESLEIELTDGQVFTSGSLKGDQGVGIADIEFVGTALRITLDDGTEVVSGDLQGPPGVSIEGLPGIGIARVYIDRRGHLIVVYTDGREQDAGLVRPKLQAPMIATGGGTREQTGGGSTKSYFATVTLPAGQWTRIQHELDLSNKNDLIMRASLVDGTEVRLGVRTIDTNALEILSLVGRAQLNISIKS